jgi:hypothetical protein
MKGYVTIVRVKGLTESVSNSPKAFGSMVRSLTVGIKAGTMSRV